MQYLLPNAHDKIYVFSVITGAIVNLFINIMLIPSLQAVGAVIGTLVAEFIVAAIQTIFCVKRLPIRKYMNTTLFYIAIGSLMFVWISIIKKHIAFGISSLLLLIVIGGGFYVIVSMLLNWMINTSLFQYASQMVRKKVINN